MSKIKIFALGGLNENGKNMYVVDVDQNIFVFDAGLKYPTANMLGIDYIIPKIDYLIENKKNVRGIFLSHGHEGNMGAMPDILREMPDVPVYGSKFTMDLLKGYLSKQKIKATNLKEVRPHSKIDVAGFSVFPIQLTHSVPEALAYVLYTDDGAIVYATDFVFDSTMLGSYKTDIGKLAYVGKQGVLCLLSESLYAGRAGHTSPKHRIADKVWDVLNSTDKRIIITLFQNHIYRLQEIFDQIKRTRRKVVLLGKDLQDIVDYSLKQGYLNFDKNILGTLDDVDDRDIVIITSDVKEKSFASLDKIISGYDKFVTLKEGDTVFVSEPVYPGNEKKMAKIVDDLCRLGVETVTLSFKKHLLHHASKEDLMQMIDLISPKYYFPIKGEYRYMYMNAALAEQTGMSKDNIILKLNGEVASFENGKLLDKKETVPIDEILIDGKTTEDVGELVLKDRELLSKNGIVLVSATIDKNTKEILSNPQILTRGFIYVRENKDMIDKSEMICKNVIEEVIEDNFRKVDFSRIKQDIRKELGDYFYDVTGTIPMILTVILEV